MTDSNGERIAVITRLYLIVHGRSPDFEGLNAYVGHLREGKTLLQVATEFIESDEFTRRIPRKDAAAELCRNAFGSGRDGCQPPSGCGTIAALATALVLLDPVQHRLPVLPALFPNGVPLHDPAAYRLWLSQQPATAMEGASLVAPDPALSIIVLFVDRPNLQWLEGMLASVLDTPASRVELLVATRGRCPAPVAWRVGTDRRLRLVRAPFWCGAASLFNRALAYCNGEFTGLIGQHDVLSASAVATLSTVAATADIALSDDDALDVDSKRRNPRLGAGWDPDLTIASGRPGLILVRTALLRRVGGMRRQVPEEWDFLLRAAAVAQVRVVHTPSVTLSRREPIAPHRSGRAYRGAALQQLAVAGPGGCITSSEDGVLRVVYPVPRTPPRASIVIPTRDRADLLRTCMDGLLRRTAYPDIEVVIVDNGSTDPDARALLQELSQDRRVRVLGQPGPFNWSALNNAGVGQMSGEVAVLLNNDIDVIEPGWLREMVSQALRPGVGVVGAKLLYSNRTVQHAGIVLGPDGRGTHMWRHAPESARGYLDQLIATREVSAMTGACLAMRRTVYAAAGGCEADHLAVTWNDVDLCLRVRGLGLRAIWTPYARLLHLEQATRGTDDTQAHQERFRRERDWMRTRWNEAIDADPFLSPFLLPSEADPEPLLVVR